MDAPRSDALQALGQLLDVIERLRAPGGCPWDRAQTESTMAPHLLEEAYEAVDAIEGGTAADVAEELGDVLMNVLMVAQIAREAQRFQIADVARAIAEKLVRRHPHVFAAGGARSAEQVLVDWEAIKRRERGDGRPRSALDGVPRALPALLRACRVSEKAARVGFDWPDSAGPRRKVDEELAEFDQALARGDAGAIRDELGDLLFSLCNLARHHGIEPETALRTTVDRFSARFRAIEAELGDRLGAASLAELEAAWQRAKGSADTAD